MYTQAEDKYQEVMKTIYTENADPVEVERAAFGFDHCEIGRLVLQKWKIPARLALAIGSHHDPMSAAGEEGEKPLAALLQVADRMCLHAGLGRRETNESINPFDCDGARILDLGDLDPEETLTRFKEAYEQEKELFS
jgi:HD-like signal output (HDOD) protein